MIEGDWRRVTIFRINFLFTFVFATVKENIASYEPLTSLSRALNFMFHSAR